MEAGLMLLFPFFFCPSQYFYEVQGKQLTFGEEEVHGKGRPTLPFQARPGSVHFGEY
jgi:hypothetical protein